MTPITEILLLYRACNNTAEFATRAVKPFQAEMGSLARVFAVMGWYFIGFGSAPFFVH